MEKPFVYGMSVEGKNFIDRENERERLKKDFECGVNVIIISPRRMGKTSLVKKVRSELQNPKIVVVLLDAYDCRSEYDFYNKFATALMVQTASTSARVIENIKQFLIRVSPKISFSPEPNSNFSLSLGITPKEYTPEEILNIPEIIAKEKDIHIVVCIDEFQQIGEFPDSINVQKRLRGVWQHQQNVSYCLFGSKKHLMTKLFKSRRMPFFQFGEMLELKKIPTDAWIHFIVGRFKEYKKVISEDLAKSICEKVENYSSYVQQLVWNVMAESGDVVTEADFISGFDALLAQNVSFFTEQTRGLSSYQLNMIRAVCRGYHSGFGTKEVSEQFSFGVKSNISRIKAKLIDREIIEEEKGEVYLADPLFEYWFKREFM